MNVVMRDVFEPGGLGSRPVSTRTHHTVAHAGILDAVAGDAWIKGGIPE